MKIFKKIITLINIAVLSVVALPVLFSVMNAQAVGEAVYIYGCKNDNTEAVKIKATAGQCSAAETEINWQQAPVAGTDFVLIMSGGSFDDIGDRLAGVNYANAIISGVTFSGASSGVDMSAINLSGAYLDTVTFAAVDLNHADFSGIDKFEVTMSNVDLSYADFSNTALGASTNITGTNFQNANFTNTDFSNGPSISSADFTGANVTGMDWAGNICPDGTSSAENGFPETCVGHLTP